MSQENCRADLHARPGADVQVGQIRRDDAFATIEWIDALPAAE
ncbi:hypothetical protein FLP41_03330 (plasmid) [Paracoccus marcusii]|nr:hypothetical protein FLP41_03330 [Paracoccus marcusii]